MRTDDEDSPIFVGTYADAGGEGVYPLHRSGSSWSLGEPYRGGANASYGAYSPRHGIHFLVDERGHGTVGAYRRERAGWRPLSRVPSGGREPCYAALDPAEDWLAVANYGSGSLSLFRLDPATGLMGDPADCRQNAGHGPVPDRQEGPHAHCAVFSRDGRWLYQTDLGTDQVLAFAVDRERGLLGEAKVAFDAPAGSGPRHLVFHPGEPLAVLVSELASTITLFEVGDGTLRERQSLATAPPGACDGNLGGHVALNAAGDRVYVTNRGHDTIALFALDPARGLTPLGETPAGGASPRFFLLLEGERTMFVANEEGNSITVFDVREDGALEQSGELAVKGPAYLFVDRTWS